LENQTPRAGSLPSRDLTDPHKGALTLRGTNHHWDVQALRCTEDRLQQDKVRDVEMTDCHSALLHLF
jgi:hypothetical protein